MQDDAEQNGPVSDPAQPTVPQPDKAPEAPGAALPPETPAPRAPELPRQERPNHMPWTIPCREQSCPLNNGEQCQMVCGIKIGTNGRCDMSERLARVGVFKMERALCRGCGLPIVRRLPEDQWHHVGLPLRHPAEPAAAPVLSDADPGAEFLQ